MKYKQNIFEKAFVVTVRRGDTKIDMVFWSESKKALRERLEIQLDPRMEIVGIRERD